MTTKPVLSVAIMSLLVAGCSLSDKSTLVGFIYDIDKARTVAASNNLDSQKALAEQAIQVVEGTPELRACWHGKPVTTANADHECLRKSKAIAQ
jgi:hypothetical protein